MIQTEQISSSMQLKLILEQREASYTKRNIMLRYSSPSPHLSSRVYDIKDQICKDGDRLPRVEERRSVNMRGDVMKKTGSYWMGIKSSIKLMNSKMQY